MKINSLSNFKYNLSNVGIKSNRQNSYKTAPMSYDSVSFGYFPSRYSHDYEFELYKKTGMDENTQLMLAKTPEETKRILRLAGLDFKYDKNDILSDILTAYNRNYDTALTLSNSAEQSEVLLKAAHDEETLKNILSKFPQICATDSLELVEAFLNAAPDEESLNNLLEKFPEISLTDSPELL